MIWYAITTTPSGEHRVRKALLENGVNAYYPVEKLWRVTPRKRTTLERPLARGYVFAQTDDHASLVAMTHDIAEAVRVFGFKRSGPEIERFIIELQADEAAGAFDATVARDRSGKIKRALEPGDQIKVSAGPFFGFGGKLLKLSANRRATIILQMLGGEVTMSIDTLKLEAA